MTSTTYGECLICREPKPVDGRAVVRHVVDTEQPGAEPFADGWVCLGSGHFPVRYDGHDETRRYAVRRFAVARRAAAKLRGELTSAIGNEDWPVADLIAHYGATTALNESLCRYWRELANHGDPLHVIKNALADFYPGSQGSLTEQAMADAKAAAARQFMREVRRMLERAYPDGFSADQVATIFFSI